MELRVGVIVEVIKEAMEDNGAGGLDLDYGEYFTIIRCLHIGEPAYNLRGVDSGNKVFIGEDQEYNFVAEELKVWEAQ